MQSDPTSSQAVPIILYLQGGKEIDEGDLDLMTASLRKELEEIPSVVKIDRLTTGSGGTRDVPRGTKAAEAFAVGALLISLLPVALPELIGLLKEWSLRPGARPVRIKVQHGSRSSEVEYDPRTITSRKVKQLASELSTLLGKK